MSKRKINLSKKSIIAIIVSLVLVIIGATACTVVMLHSKNKTTPVFFSTDKSIVNGIDVSQHNGNIDWKKVKKGKTEFAFVRVGYSGYTNGTNYPDKTYNDNLKGANKNDLPVGVYYYSQATTKKEAKKEAEYTLSLVKKYDINLPIAMDVEYAYDSNGKEDGRLFDANLTESEQTEIINEFCKVIAKAGYTPMVYANSYMFGTRIDTSKLNSNIMIWVADYNKQITYEGKYNVWQYSKTGSVDGIASKHVDKNYWYIKKG